MHESYLTYLDLLTELTGKLDQLTTLAQQKIEAVRRDDLSALDAVLKQEQVLSLSLRGLEQRRGTLTAQLNLGGVRLSGLPDRYPPELYPQAKQTAELLRRSYDLYHAAAQAARVTLETNLHELEKLIDSMGGAPEPGTPGYTPPAAEPPKNMKTDFRA
ncbi:MAG: flagellar protein FlgN [Lawsonibacter sp.]|nr:flagellar protein FlgN [Lawsonibacter sp.]